MNTHVLISIKDAEEAFKEMPVRNFNIIKVFLSETGKQISLNEDDIEAKAAAFAKTGVTSGKFGYKQALKDLL